MTKQDKVERLITINYVNSVTLKHHKELVEKTCKRWSHKGLDFLLNLWHTYYNSDSHACITQTMFLYGEKQINLLNIEKALKSLSVNQ